MGSLHKSYSSKALAPPRDHSPSSIPALKSYPSHCSKSCDHHSSQGCPRTACPHHLLPPGYLAGSSAWAAPTALRTGVGCGTRDTMASRLSNTVLDQLKYHTGLSEIPRVLPSPSTGNQRYPADMAGHSSCPTSSAAALKAKQNKKPPHTGPVMKS